MRISPVYRASISLVWFPSLDDIRSGAYLELVPFRRSLLLRQVLWLPRNCDTACVAPDREVSTRRPTERPHEPRRIWPFNWPTAIVEIKCINQHEVPPAPEPAATVLDLFI